ncbi:MAG: minor tail protein [Bacteriophage sp.]|nr:MAG: minor tail protein [Bacteriophage sp.]
MAAGRNIKGITIEIGGDTTGLQKALSGANDKLKNTQAQLKDVNTLLKLDPSNTVLVAQKQELLKNAIADTASKLDTLEAAQKDVTAALEAGKIGQEEYMAFQREVEATKATLSRYQSELDGLNTEQDRLATNTERLSKLFDALGADVDDYADVLGSKLVTAIKNGSASSDQLKLAIEKIGRSATDGKADIKQMTDALDTVDDGQAIKNLIQDLKEAGTQADNTSEQLDEMGKTLSAGALMEAADQLSGLGDKITELGDKAKDAFLETQDATVKASTYFGETGKAAEETAGVIKDVYAEGVGDSMDSVSNAVITVKKNLKDLDETTLTHLTEQAITLDELYGIDMNETLRGVNSLMEQYGLTAQQAMDYIVKGTQNGLDKTNELGDNLSEYSGKFAQAGYSAQEYFQLLQNGLDNGAYNLDKVNDAINEVTTRLVDGTIADSLSKIDEKTGEVQAGTGGWNKEVEDVFKQWQQGGATQKDVIDAIVTDIQNTENQQDKLNKAALAFGTMAEDGNAKFIESLTTVGDTYDDVAGSAENMFDQSTTDSQTFEASMRQLEQSLVPLGEALMNLANNIIPPIASGIKTIGEFFGKLPEPVQNFVVILGAVIAAFTTLAPAILAVINIVSILGVATLGPIIGIIAGVAAAITAIIAIVKNWGAISEWFGEIWEKVKEKCSQVWESICSFFTDTIPQAWQNVVSWFQGIPEWWSGIWQQVADFFSGIWQSMMENPVLSSIVTTIQELWQNAVTTLQGIWSGLTEIASGAWELLKNTILAPVLLLIDLVTGDFTQLASDAQNIWQNIQDAASQIWSGIQQVVTSFAEGLVTHVVTLVTGFMDTLSSLWDMIKQTALNTWENLKNSVVQTATNLKDSAIQALQNLKESAYQKWQEMKQNAHDSWENLKSSVVQTAQNLKESAVQAFHNMVSGIGNALSSLGSTVRNGFWSAISFITSLPSQAVQWGRDFIDGIVSGIRNAIGRVRDAVSDVASTIRSFLHFSVPDEGPLTEYESWMPDFMQGLAKGIEKSKSVVADAIEGVSKDMTINANAMMDQSNAKQTNAIMNITSLLAQYLPYLAKSLNIEWDTGGVAAKLARDMDRELGILAEEGGFL